MTNYEELIQLLANPIAERDNADLMIAAANAIEQLIKERDDFEEAANDFQQLFFEKSRDYIKLQKEFKHQAVVENCEKHSLCFKCPIWKYMEQNNIERCSEITDEKQYELLLKYSIVHKI